MARLELLGIESDRQGVTAQLITEAEELSGGLGLIATDVLNQIVSGPVIAKTLKMRSVGVMVNTFKERD